MPELSRETAPNRLLGWFSPRDFGLLQINPEQVDLPLRK